MVVLVEREAASGLGLIDLLGCGLSIGWPYNGPMEIVNSEPGQMDVSLRGDCPHCGRASYFRQVASVYTENVPDGQRVCGATQCQNCQQYLLAIGKRQQGNEPLEYEAHYPIGQPDDTVAEEVPESIAVDFSEALRCFWIKAYRATVTMCRRSLQASCLEKEAKGKQLIDQIDNLAKDGIITEPLRLMAHEVRLTGNIGAHPDEDGLEDVDKEDAADIIEFAREYFDHVYVISTKLAAMTKRRKDRKAGADPNDNAD